MKLVAFRVQNFRSIIDTGWCELSTDNITALIGQNESGKSAILAALSIFYSPELEDDSVRSDGSMPEISCSFEVSKKEILDVLQDNAMPKGLQNTLKADSWRIGLTRRWSGLDEDTTLDIEDDALKQLFVDQEQEARTQAEAKTAARQAAEAATAPVAAEAEAEEPEEVVAPATVEPVSPAPAPVAPAAVATVEPASVAVPTPEPASAPEPEPVVVEPEEPDEPEVSVMGYKGFLDTLFGKLPEFVMFTDEASFLPATIDLDAIVSDKADTHGIVGAKNFLALTGLTPEDILVKSHRRSGVKIRTANKKLTADFHGFWQQYIGKETNKVEIEVELKNYDDSVKGKAGKPYLVFWVKNGEELLAPAQRSKGLQWFLSFFLQLRASALPNAKEQILLIDEPGQSLHIKAQKDILKVFEKSRKNFQIIYTTHSPYLIEADSLHRLLAVQRSGEGDTGESEVFSARKLARANIDTLFPIYSLIGADLGSQAVIERTNNVILEEPSGFYYLMSFLLLTGEKHKVNFLPATGVTNVRTFVNLFLGWGLDFLVIVDEDAEGTGQVKLIQESVYGGDTAESAKHLMQIKGCEGVEDIFTKGDFKKYVLKDAKLTFTDNNSKYLKTTKLSKPLLAIDFYQRVKDGELTLTDLATTTQKDIKALVDDIINHLKELENPSDESTSGSSTPA
jgi:ABC-type cobalamin/Fe3+-siderophores transport system ATPase subunit